MKSVSNGLKILTAVSTPSQISTAIGDIPTDMVGFVDKAVSIGVGLGGVIAVAMLAYGAFTILTSTGEPEKLMNGREIITNSLMGLALIVLSVFVLEFLGMDILGINELGQWI